MKSQRLADMLASARFEILPFGGVEEQLSVLPAGSTVTVTSSPKKDIEDTLRFAGSVKSRGFNVVPHIAARKVRDRLHLKNILLILSELGISEIFVIGGDAEAPAGDFDSSLQLLDVMETMPHSIEKVGVAGYPEGHGFIDNRMLNFALEAKSRYADYIVTQMCFNPKAIVNWSRRIEQNGILQSVYVGVPGITQRLKLLKIGSRIGMGQSLKFAKKNRSFVSSMLRPGTSHTERLVLGLSTAIEDRSVNIKGFHLFTFNDIVASEALRRSLSGRFKPAY